MCILISLQENGQLKKIPLDKLQPDSRFIIDVNQTEGNLNRKLYYVPMRLLVWLIAGPGYSGRYLNPLPTYPFICATQNLSKVGKTYVLKTQQIQLAVSYVAYSGNL